MATVERILCPVGPSLDSNRALRYAAVLAHSYGARLTALTCVGDSADDAADGADEIAGPAPVLVAHDFSDHAESALTCACAFARPLRPPHIPLPARDGAAVPACKGAA